jgi:hypothetical protein
MLKGHRKWGTPSSLVPGNCIVVELVVEGIIDILPKHVELRRKPLLNAEERWASVAER